MKRHRSPSTPHWRATEHQEQATFFDRAAWYVNQIPELRVMHAIPNAGAGAQRGQAGKMRAEGVKAGVPDVCLPVPRGHHAGLYLEFKRHGQKPTAVQLEWHQRLRCYGHRVEIVYGADHAWALTLEYLDALERDPTIRRDWRKQVEHA